MKVFISYSHKDETLARKVTEVIEEAGLEVWYDKREIKPGENWAEMIARGLKESDAMVLLLTPDALASELVRLNIEYALGEKTYNNRLIPVLVGQPEDFPMDKLPWILKRLKTITLPERGRDQESLRQIAQALKEVA